MKLAQRGAEVKIPWPKQHVKSTNDGAVYIDIQQSHKCVTELAQRGTIKSQIPRPKQHVKSTNDGAVHIDIQQSHKCVTESAQRGTIKSQIPWPKQHVKSTNDIAVAIYHNRVSRLKIYNHQ
jgi:hypothetical protein